MDLRDAAVLGVAESTDGGDDVEAELVLGQGEVALLLGPEGRGSVGSRDCGSGGPSDVRRMTPSRVVTVRQFL